MTHQEKIDKLSNDLLSDSGVSLKDKYHRLIIINTEQSPNICIWFPFWLFFGIIGICFNLMAIKTQ